MDRGSVVWVAVLVALSLLLVIPATHEIFIHLTQNHKYPMAFVKFAILATMGELLASRILHKRWNRPKGFWAKVAVWGVYGMLLSVMFDFNGYGARGAVADGMLPAPADGFGRALLVAFYTSLFHNSTMGVMYMASHRVWDTLIDRTVDNCQPPGFMGAVEAVDWLGFIKIIVLKMVPFFWIPVHTVVFLLPNEYRILVSAYLSIALGAMMAYVKRQGQVKASMAAAGA